MMSLFRRAVVGEVRRAGWGGRSSVSCCRDDGNEEWDFGIIEVLVFWGDLDCGVGLDWEVGLDWVLGMDCAV